MNDPLSPDLQRQLITVLVEAKAGGATAAQVTAAFHRGRRTVFAESVGSYVLDDQQHKEVLLGQVQTAFESAVAAGIPAREFLERISAQARPLIDADMVQAATEPKHRRTLAPQIQAMVQRIKEEDDREWDRIMAIPEKQRDVLEAHKLNGIKARRELALLEALLEQAAHEHESPDDTSAMVRASASKMAAMLDTEELPVDKLNELVVRLAAASDKASGDAIRKQIIAGFYGTHSEPKLRRMKWKRKAWANLPSRLAELQQSPQIPVRQLTGEELGELADRLAAAKTEAEAKVLIEEIVRGFYGKKAHR